MTNEQWEKLKAVIEGETFDPVPKGFIIDSPWLPGWSGCSTISYFSNSEAWFQANKKAVEQFPDTMFLPGFWSEFGMCTEPSAFGSKCTWPENELPYAEKIISKIKQFEKINKPDPSIHGLLPHVISRLKYYQKEIEEMGHAIRFAVSRGPLNIASFLMGTTEFLTALRTDPEDAKGFLQLITDFIVDWLAFQAETFKTIQGVFILDDIVGFVGENDFKTFAKPYLAKIFQAFNFPINFFHNDAAGRVCAPYLKDIGINLFNFSFEHSLDEMKQLTENKVTLLGNLPPRDVLAASDPDKVQAECSSMMESVSDKRRIIFSCGGGIPPGVSTENMEAFIRA